jgi:hypothetical protein
VLCSNVLWVYSNLLGEPNNEIYNMIVGNTVIIDFIAASINWDTGSIPPEMLELLPWVCNNIARFEEKVSVKDVCINILF